MNFQKNLNEKTFYDILGCDRGASIEQINTEFKIRALKCHPDKNQNVHGKSEEFQALIEAKETLNNCRGKYDSWIDSGMFMSWIEWVRFTDQNKIIYHWHSPKVNPMLTDRDKKQLNTSDFGNCDLNGFRSTETNNHKDDDILMKFRKNII